MSETVKLIIEIPKKIYEHALDGVTKFVTAEMDVEIEKAVKNGTLLDDVTAEITKKAFTEEIFDEDVFRSTYTESMTREEAECESVIETEIVKLSDVLEIIDNIGKVGEWIYQGDEISGELKCSVCGETVGMDGENYRICPYCGSVMKVEKDFSQRGEQNET